MRFTFAARLLLSITGFVAGGVLSWSDSSPSIIFHLKSGTKIMMPIDDNPVIAFDNGAITIGNDRYSISDISKYTIIGTSAGVDGVIADGIMISSDNITMRNIADANALHVYTIGGVECECPKSISNNCIIINISGLSRGYYILSIGSENIKFGKK